MKAMLAKKSDFFAKIPKVALRGKLFFYLFLLLLPISTKKLFFTENSFYFGYHAFYNTFYLYLTDLIFLCLIIAWLWESLDFSREKSAFIPLFQKIKQLSHNIFTKCSQDGIYLLFIAFWLILATSLIFSREISIGFYGLARIMQFFLIFVYIRENFSLNTEFSREISRVFWLMLATLWFQSALGIYQYLNQESLGLKLFGEEFLHPGLQGIAKFASHGVINPIFDNFFPYLSPISDQTANIRAYGTLPHPNVLAAFLLAGLMINLYLLYISREKYAKLVLGLSLIVLATALVVTFSRLAWVISAIAIGAWFLLIFWKIRPGHVWAMKTGKLKLQRNEYSPHRLTLIAGILLLSAGLNFFVFGEQIKDRLGIRLINFKNYVADESLINRELYNQIAFRMIKENPVLGAGLKNFVVEMDNFVSERLLPYLHQPVHNIYLLIAAEGGILALAVFGMLLFYIVRHAGLNLSPPILRYTLFLIFFAFLALGFFDHYFWSIQQGSLLFWIILGFLAIKNRHKLAGFVPPM